MNNIKEHWEQEFTLQCVTIQLNNNLKRILHTKCNAWSSCILGIVHQRLDEIGSIIGTNMRLIIYYGNFLCWVAIQN